MRIYQQRFEWSQLIVFCFLFELNLQGQYSTVQIQGNVFADCAVLSRWVNRACVALTVEQLCVNRFLEQQLKGCSVCETYLTTLVKPRTTFLHAHKDLECEAHGFFPPSSFHIKEHPEFALSKLSPLCPFQNNLTACNKKMSVLLSVENLTVCGFVFIIS